MLLHNLGLGGAQTAACNLARALAMLACFPVMCAWRRGGALELDLRAAGIPVEVPAVEPSSWRRLCVAGRLRAIIDRYRIDVIHAHMSDSAAWAALLARLTGREYVITHHSNDLTDSVGHGRWLYGCARNQLLFRCARRAAANIAVSASVRDRLAVRARIGRERVFVVPNSIALPPELAVAQARARRRQDAAAGFRSHGRPRIVYAGRLHTSKRLDTLIAAAPKVIERFPQATFTLLGDGPLAPTLRAHVRALGLADRFVFPGAVADVGVWLAAADLYATASHLEGLSVAVLEAMSWGLPIVASDIAGHREIVRPGETGLLVPVAAPDALADAVVTTLEDWSATEHRAACALELVRQHFHVDQAARRNLDIYRQCLPGGKP